MKRTKNTNCIALFCIALFLSHICFAKETTNKEVKNSKDKESVQTTDEAPTIKERLLKKNRQLSDRFEELAISIDTLLSNEAPPPSNESRISLISFTRSREDTGIEQDFHVDADLRLPQFEKEWKLRFSSFDDEDEFEGLERNRPGAQPQEQKYGTSLAFIRRIQEIDVTFRPRAELKDPFVSSILLKLRHIYEGKWMTTHTRLKLFAHSVDGAGQSLSIYFEKSLTPNLFLRIFNEEQYLDRLNRLSVSQGPTLLQRIDDRTAMSYTLSVNSASRTVPERTWLGSYETNSYHLQSYQAIVSLNHRLYRNVFHFQVSPLIDFGKHYNFKGKAGVNLRLEVIF